MIILQLAMDTQCQLMITVSYLQSALTVVLCWVNLFQNGMPNAESLFCNGAINGHFFRPHVFMTLSIDSVPRFSGAKTPESNQLIIADDSNKSMAHAIVTKPVVLAIELAPSKPLSTISQIT